MESSSPPPLRVVGQGPMPVVSYKPVAKVRMIGGHPHLIQVWAALFWDAMPDADKPPNAEHFYDPDKGVDVWQDIQPLPPGVRMGLPEA